MSKTPYNGAMNSQSYALNISPHLHDKGQTQAEKVQWLMDHLGVTRPTALNLLRDKGTAIRFKTLRALSDNLEVPLDKLLIPI